MPELNRLLTENLAVAFGVLVVLVLLLLIGFIVQSARLGRAVRDYRDLVGDGQGGSLHNLLAGQAEVVSRASQRLTEMEATHGPIDERSQRSIQHIGMVRFNPFEDTGSDQSFAIALLDNRRDGVVISSLHGRSNTRVFAKPVADGGSKHHLSDEESEAIRIAVGGTRPE